MATALLVARVVLAAVFATAAAAKLADRGGSRQAMVDFGFPAAFAPVLAILLPLAELGVAASLLARPTAWWGALAGLGLLAVFTAAIAANLARGRKPDCHCFGQIHSAPAGWPTLARNVALGAVAGFVVWGGSADPGLSTVPWFAGLDPIGLVVLLGGGFLLALVALEGWLLVQLFRQHGRVLLRLDALEGGRGGHSPSAGAAARQTRGLAVGSKAPDFELPSLTGEPVTLASLRARARPVMLVFTDPDCGPCTALLPELGRWQREHADDLTFALVSRGRAADNAASEEHGISPVLLEADHEVTAAYKVAGTPSAVLVRPEGTIASAPAAGSQAIRALLGAALGNSLPPVVQAPGANRGRGDRPARPALGDPAPELELLGLRGESVKLSHFRGHRTLVVFWNPGCGFCQTMLDDLKAWERDRSPDAPRLLVISRGTGEANRAMGLASPILLDQELAAARAFGAGGTPMAVVLDEEGRIASPITAGAPGVLALGTAIRAEPPAPSGV